jgi:hypothetical protein
MANKKPESENGRAGMATDRFGGPVVDPTANVIALVEANKVSSDMLRQADIKFNDEVHKHIKEIGNLRAMHAETLRVSDLDRLDKTRQVDVLAGTASASALATAVQTLANTSDRNAETLRNLVNATAATMAKQTADQAQVLSAQTAALVTDINARIAELQKSQYQGSGKASVADPIMVELVAEVKKLSSGQSVSTGTSKGISLVGALIIGAVAVISGLVGLSGFLYAVLK